MIIFYSEKQRDTLLSSRNKAAKLYLTLLCILLISLAFSPAALAAGGDPKIVWDGSEPAQGVFFYWYEPSFYTGFAPRTQDPTRPHIQLSRGNQLRVTLVLGPDELDNYADDLVLRQKTYQSLLDKKIIKLSVNMSYERFARAMKKNGVSELATSKSSLEPEAYRQKSADLMAALNPGRIFQIRMPVERVLASWHQHLTGIKEQGLTDEVVRLDAANAILPGRVNLSTLTPEQIKLLEAAATLSWQARGASDPAFTAKALKFLQTVTLGHYPVNKGNIEAVEFTSIIPVGTLQSTIKYKQWTLSSFGVTGIWSLIPRKEGQGQLGMVDYIHPNPGYGYIPLLPYQHATGVYYNSFHNTGVRCQLNQARFLPEEWRHVAGERNPEKNYQNLWLVSRGPASHGCTRLPSGYMSELRHMLPSSSDILAKVRTYRNLPQCYELFDIDGNGTPEVMGIQYYLAFSGKKHIPQNAYAQNNRKDFYVWMYEDNVSYNSDDSAVIGETPTCRFVGKKAKEARTFQNQPLYEAEYYHEEIQFYQLKATAFNSPRGYTFNRELRRIGVGYDTDMKNLYLK
ncbi:MAG: hypothetical protein GQ559_10600 [Desulfobulbaceae bacterium]|nr:hypothetical protein [Desulfobulbaceae bacterium]